MRKLLLAGLGAALLAAGCGGGGDGGGTPVVTPAPSVTIAQANEVDVARSAVNVAVAANIADSTVPIDVLGAADRVAAAAAKPGGALASAVRAGSLGQALQLLTVDLVASPIQSLDASSVTKQVVVPEACPLGGQADVNAVDRDASGTVSTGDTASVVFTNCRPIAGVTVNGSVAISFDEVNRAASRVRATVNYGNLGATAPEGSFAINGSLSLAVTVSGALRTAEQVIGAGGLTARVISISPAFDETLTLHAGLTVSASENLSAPQPGGGLGTLLTSAVNGSVSSTRLAGGTIAIQTVAPLQTFGNNDYPSQGQVVVTGAANSKLRLTALSATQVRIEVDANGDGSFERNNVYNWTDLI